MSRTVNSAKEAFKTANEKSANGSKHVFVLIDESGSMDGLQEPVTTGCNELIHEFKDDPSVRIWLAWFDESPGEPRTRFRVKGLPASEVAQLMPSDYNPRGLTPLNDAIADAVAALDSATGKHDVVFLAIFTDGLENASEHSTASIKTLLEQCEAAGWGIVFVGANQDTVKTAAQFGMRKRGRAFDFDANEQSVRRSMRGVSAVMKMRIDKSVGADGLHAYDEEVAAEYTRRGGRLDDAD